MIDTFKKIYQQIVRDSSNQEMKTRGYKPLYTVGENAKIVIIGQAPGRKAQESKVPWDDASGDSLRDWLGIDRKVFYDSEIISLLPMDFYYPGKGPHGDLPPRKDFAPKWHGRLLKLMPNVELIILIGNYAQKYYLQKNAEKNLTQTVYGFKKYLPTYFPLVHPSPLNFRWQAKNLWFKKQVIPELQKRVKKILKKELL